MHYLGRASRILAGACLAALLVVSPVYSQTDAASLYGLVRDPSGASIIGARVILKSQATGGVREQKTDAKGLYHFEVLSPGLYELAVESTGFKQFRDSNVRVQVAQASRLNAQLEIGSASEFIEVRDTVSALNTQNVSQGTIIGQEKIVQLPLNGRQFIQLALLVPGASAGGRMVQQNLVRQGQLGGLSISGNRTNNTVFLLDGAANTDPDYSSLNYSPQIDSIAEFQVQTAMVGAEYARASVNVTSKSGSNDIHGTAFEFLRNKAFDARPFNAPSDLPKFQRNQFGGTLGGPLVRNRLFGFGAFEGLRVGQAGAGLTTQIVPSALQRQGDFSRTAGGIFDPDTALVNGERSPFPNNRIPASRMSPLSLAAINAMPLPTDANGTTFVNSNGILRQDVENYSGRVDYNLTPSLNLFGRYSISEEGALIPDVVPGRDNINNARSQNAVLGATKVVSSNLVNEARFGFSRLRIHTGLPELSFNVDGQQRPMPRFIVGPYPTMGGAGGFTGTTGGGIVLVRNNSFQFYDNVSWNVGRHSIKFGGEIYWVQYNRFESPNVQGTYTFTNGFTTRGARNDGTGDSLASLMLGYPQIGNRSIGPSRIDGRQRTHSLYIQDDLHLTPDLTLNLGLRYEIAAPMHDKHQQMSSIDYRNVPNPGQVFAEGKTNFYRPTLFVCGQSGYPRGCSYTDKNNFAPRAGIVWSATRRTVIRAGAGIFYAGNDSNPLFRLAAGLPGNIAQTLNSDNFTPRYKSLDIFGPTVVGPAQIQAAGIDLHQRGSYSMQWNFSVQRELAKSVALEVGYLATLGLKLEQNVQPNNALPGAGAVDPRRPYAGVTYAPGTVFPNYIVVQGSSVPVGFINYVPRSAQSNYHSMFLRLEKRFSRGLSFLSSYTFSKSITNAPQFRNAGGVNGNENSPAQDSYNLRAERGLASFHNTHRFVNTYLYDLPMAKNKGALTAIFSNFQISGILAMQTGFPFTVNLRGDTAGVGAGTGGIFVRPNLVSGANWELPGSEQSTSRFFNTAAFVAPPAAAFGNVGKNTVIGPGMTNLDFVLAKSIAVSERVQLQLRLEFFNAFNHSNYNIVGRILNDPTFGRVLNQLDPRQIQLGAKITF